MYQTETEMEFETDPISIESDPISTEFEPIPNPWQVESVQDFIYINCPECVFKTKEGSSFQNHAIQNHPQSHIFFDTQYDDVKPDPLNLNSEIKVNRRKQSLEPRPNLEPNLEPNCELIVKQELPDDEPMIDDDYDTKG